MPRPKSCDVVSPPEVLKYITIPRVIWDMRRKGQLTPMEMELWARLHSLGLDDVCLEQLAKEFGSSVRVIRRVLSRLKNLGLIAVEREGDFGSPVIKTVLPYVRWSDR